MATIIRARPIAIHWHPATWLPLPILPAAVIVLAAGRPAWVQMWTLAIAIYASFKWLTFATSQNAAHATPWRAAGYLFLWTGMDAESFFGKAAPAALPRRSELAWAISQTALGLCLLLALAPRLVQSHPLVAGWLTMIGFVSILHFGVSHLFSLAWRSAGVNAQHIMHQPLFAVSLTDFWGKRWNLPFRDLMHQFVFKPLVSSVGIGWATMAVFFVSGLIHDAVISLTAHGGWGQPTLYFLIQGVAILFQRSHVGKRLGLNRGFLGRLFAATVVIAPAGLLFHPPFIRNVVVPMLPAIQGLLP